MIKLSVIIVNYNVKYFLEQCLHSIYKASEGINTEVFVVDNNSVDGSVKMIKERFPEVILIENKENLGISKANNQAIVLSKGEYVLLINPDTVVENTTFKKVIDFMDSHIDAGGLGVKMIDGKGKFLPESKRSLPKPSVAFYKIFGLSRIFPKSKTFGKYHLGNLNKDKIHQVEILSGAFMLLRKEVLNEIGLLDEAYFMYGEDVDLSYRILKAGYKNYYFPETRIIHYKGESTKKSSINYVIVFYNAMIIFAKKHFSHKNAKLFSILIHFAIYLRAFVAISNRFLKNIILPFTDIVFIFAGIYFLKNYWENIILSGAGGHYPNEFLFIFIPAFIFIWLISVMYSGGYDKPIKLIKIFQGVLIGTTIILVIYALLNESYRFSRALIIFGASWALIYMISIRYILHMLKVKNFCIDTVKNKRFAIIGEKIEAERVAALLKQTDVNTGFIGLVNISEKELKENGFIGNISQIKEIIEIYGIDDIVFCAKDISSNNIIDMMSYLQNTQVDYKIAPPESLYIIGSNSIDTSSDLYVININSISKINNKRTKRFLDILLSLVLIIILPFAIFIVGNPPNLIKNIVLVIFKRKTWVGYYNTLENHKLPNLTKGILNPTDAFKNKAFTNDTIDKLNMLYARDYKLFNDIKIIWRGFKNLSRKT